MLLVATCYGGLPFFAGVTCCKPYAVVAETVRTGPSSTMPGAPYVVSLEDDAALQLTQHGAAVLLLDVPEGTIIGIDQQVREELPLLLQYPVLASL